MTRVRLAGHVRLDDVRRRHGDRSSVLAALPGSARAAWSDPQVRVDLDLVLPGSVVLRTRHAMRDGQVVALARLGAADPVEASWFGVGRWAGELARVATVGSPARAAGRAPRTVSGHRLPECRTRLRARVAGRRAVGVAGWVLLADGWLRLEPVGARVRLTPVTPGDVATELLVGVAAVRA